MMSMFQHYTGFTITLGLLRRSLYLPPAKEVWGKVMFLHVSVNHSERGERSLYDVTSCLVAWSHVPVRGGLPTAGGGLRTIPTRTRKVGGAHPTGILSCQKK